MKLVGATDWFIRWPFVIEGVVLGAIGGVLAVLLLLVGKIALLDPLTQRVLADRGAARRSTSGCWSRVLLVAVGRGERRGLGAVAAPLPAGLSAAVAAPDARRGAHAVPALPPRIRVACSPRRGARRCSCSGIWVGGRHPDWLPGSVRDPLVGDQDTRGRARGDRRRPRHLLPQDPRGPARRRRDRRASSRSWTTASRTTSPRRVRALPGRRRTASSPASASPVSADQRGLRVERVYDGSPAKRAGLRAGDLIVAVGGSR